MLEKPLIVSARQTVRWAYIFLLGREPEGETIIDDYIAEGIGSSPLQLRRRLISSPEFIGGLSSMGFNLAKSISTVGPLDGMLDHSLSSSAGFFTDRFGVKTRVSYLPPTYSAYSGQVGSVDGSYDMPVHEPEELSALLRAVADAGESFTALELGAGWGPWIVLGGHLARRRGLPVSLTGVEGSAGHVAFMQTHLADNGFHPADYNVIHAVAGQHDGVAHFPKLPDPSGDWGAEAAFDAKNTSEALEEVRCLSVNTLLKDMLVVDFLHCDVQGVEADIFEAAIDAVTLQVRRVCVGTHSRGVEARLFDLLTRNGWELEFEKPCVIEQEDMQFILRADGVQVWHNPRLKQQSSK